MKVVSMKSKAEDRKTEDACCAPSGDEPAYPWGLRITLNNEQMDALGLNVLPVAGAPVALEAIGAVLSVREEAVDGGKPDRHLEIQITDLAVATPGTSKFARMYPDMQD